MELRIKLVTDPLLDQSIGEASVSVTLGMIAPPADAHADLPSLLRWARADMHRVRGHVSDRARWGPPADAWRRSN